MVAIKILGLLYILFLIFCCINIFINTFCLSIFTLLDLPIIFPDAPKFQFICIVSVCGLSINLLLGLSIFNVVRWIQKNRFCILNAILSFIGIIFFTAYCIIYDYVLSFFD